MEWSGYYPQTFDNELPDLSNRPIGLVFSGMHLGPYVHPSEPIHVESFSCKPFLGNFLPCTLLLVIAGNKKKTVFCIPVFPIIARRLYYTDILSLAGKNTQCVNFARKFLRKRERHHHKREEFSPLIMLKYTPDLHD